jgi:hypothetical protein
MNWKMAGLIAEGLKDGEASPVVYVSGEEVCFYPVI